MEGSKD
jgi:hypothetical protein